MLYDATLCTRLERDNKPSRDVSNTRRDGILTRRAELQQRHRAPNKPRRLHSVTTQLTSRLTVLACASELAGRPEELTTCLTSECATSENLNIWSISFANPNIGDMSMASETSHRQLVHPDHSVPTIRLRWAHTKNPVHWQCAAITYPTRQRC